MPKFEIALSGLVGFGYHGVLEHERQYGQEFVVDLIAHVSAEAEDELSGSVSYADLAELIVQDIATEPVNLLETLALRLHSKVLGHSNRITWAKVTVHKPSAPIQQRFSDVSVSYEG
jgi:7,8-dihydroneopterin aldolase/epimerase/oxygenase